jgi:tRNA nucleotidyltransferase (CCA-adding enzyme)
MKNNINNILKQEIGLVGLDKDTLKNINEVSKNFCQELRDKLKKKKIKADVFIGGSLAKNTLIKKADAKYDIDIFVRFSGYEDEEISSLLGILLRGWAKKIHGSRDYYQTIINGIVIEIIPVLKIKKPEEAKNVTDLSYFHVNYVLGCTKKNKKLGDEIRLAKAFAHANDCYGAESYIKGFSGYALELLICHYKSFLKFAKEIAKLDDSKIPLIIDDSKFYKNKKEILTEMNESKLNSPIILIDSTFKERNALAGLSKETFLKFKNACEGFLKKPSLEAFDRKGVYDKFKKEENVKIISVKTSKQSGDISGTKSKKFFNFFILRLKKEFLIKKSGFDYDDEKNIAYFYLIIDKRPKEIIKGPPIQRAEHLTAFKKSHSNAFIKKDYAWAEISHEFSFENWLKKFLQKDKDAISAMSVIEVKNVK